jgi:hypothetical protein
MSSKEKNIERALIRNPNRVKGKFTEEEMEVIRLAKSGAPQKRISYTTKVYEYLAPFNYPNVRVELGRENTGAEFNMDGVELDIPPWGAITIEEEESIVGVEVIGSACISPGYIILHAEPLEWKYPRTGVKMKVENLWGQHILGSMWNVGIDEGNRHAGMSSAHFSIPESKKVTIMAGGSMEVEARTHSYEPPSGATAENAWGDPHYCIRIIRIIVKTPIKE